MKTIQLKEFGIEIILGNVSVNDGAAQGGTISNTLHEECQFCGEDDCYLGCEEAHDYESEFDGDAPESEEDAENRKLFNASIDALESLVLAHAIAGIDVTSPDYQHGIRTAIQAYAHQYD